MHIMQKRTRIASFKNCILFGSRKKLAHDTRSRKLRKFSGTRDVSVCQPYTNAHEFRRVAC